MPYKDPAKEKARRKTVHHRAVQKNRDLKRAYGITLLDYENMYRDQLGRCAICNDFKVVLNVDHCHQTGEVRALLCNSCNGGMGLFKDDIIKLRRAADYLEKFNGR